MNPAFFTAAACCFLCACASQPENVTAAPVPVTTYAAMNCAALATESKRAAGAVAALSEKQRRDARNDAYIVAGSVLLAPVAVIAAPLTPDHSGQLAQAKGQTTAIQSALISKGCK